MDQVGPRLRRDTMAGLLPVDLLLVGFLLVVRKIQRDHWVGLQVDRKGQRDRWVGLPVDLLADLDMDRIVDPLRVDRKVGLVVDRKMAPGKGLLRTGRSILPFRVDENQTVNWAHFPGDFHEVENERVLLSVDHNHNLGHGLDVGDHSEIRGSDQSYRSVDREDLPGTGNSRRNHVMDTRTLADSLFLVSTMCSDLRAGSTDGKLPARENSSFCRARVVVFHNRCWTDSDSGKAQQLVAGSTDQGNQD